MCHGPYIVRCVLKKGAHELVDNYDGNVLLEPRNKLYVKKYYACAIAQTFTLCF